MKETIKEFSGRIVGYIDHLPNGDTVVTDFYNKRLGGYSRSQNVTKDFYGKILYYGDMSAALLVIK